MDGFAREPMMAVTARESHEQGRARVLRAGPASVASARQGLAISLMMRSIAAVILPPVTVPVLYYMAARLRRAEELRREGLLTAEPAPAAVYLPAPVAVHE